MFLNGNKYWRLASLAVVMLVSCSPAYSKKQKEEAKAQSAATAPVPEAKLEPAECQPTPEGQSSSAGQSTPSKSTSGQTTFEQKPPAIDNFRVVDSGLFRGAQPGVLDLKSLKASGVKTVINLRADENIDVSEAKFARQAGLKYINIAMTGVKGPTEGQIKQFLKITQDPDLRPVYVHCQYGRDRTGTMVGLYRLYESGWGFDQAYQEMLDSGFRPFFAQLTSVVYEHSMLLGRKPQRPLADYLVRDIEACMKGYQQTFKQYQSQFKGSKKGILSRF
jgi:protein tyrosine phosphatase (PTP) superfamily phosphohydrolase (DUF442 family)